MKAGILVDDSSPGQELHYVTAHFRDLQGLRMAPFWCAFLVLTALKKTGSFSNVYLAWTAALLTVTQFGWLHLSGRWYERHYGVVIEPEPAVPSGLISIMHPEVRSQRATNPLARRYGYLSGVYAVLFLLWALTLLPDIFLGHRSRPGEFAMLVTAYQIFPRCIYPVTNNWSVFLRRIAAMAALIAVIALYIDYRFAQIGLWNFMAVLLGALLLLDLYDHWLLNHLFGGDFSGGDHE